MKRFLFVASLLICSQARGNDAMADATAKYLAGLSLQGTPLESQSADPGWAHHAAELNRAWAILEKDQLSKIREWAPQFLGESYLDQGPMFYLFSGPDFLYANTFFPNAGTYILCGTEPVGDLPEIDKIPRDRLPSALANLRKTLDSALSWSFFITKNMKVDLQQGQLNGTLPVLYVFQARAGCVIDSVAPVALDRSGNFAGVGKGNTLGVRIVFIGRGGRQQTVYYFASDLANSGIKDNPGFLKFCEQQRQGASLLKAASYLMHEESFSQVRDFLLNHSQVIVQDDSGIPHRFFSPDKWLIRYCGRYVGPIDTFKKYWQPDLAKIYSESVPAPLDFAFGYQWRPHRSSLIVATRKQMSP